MMLMIMMMLMMTMLMMMINMMMMLTMTMLMMMLMMSVTRATRLALDNCTVIMMVGAVVGSTCDPISWCRIRVQLIGLHIVFDLFVDRIESTQNHLERILRDDIQTSASLRDDTQASMVWEFTHAWAAKGTLLHMEHTMPLYMINVSHRLMAAILHEAFTCAKCFCESLEAACMVTPEL